MLRSVAPWGVASGGLQDGLGSLKIYADSAASYQPFLTSWVAGLNFGAAVTVANAARGGDRRGTRSRPRGT